MSGPFVAKQGASLFQPTSIMGCQLWLDAVDPAGTGAIPANGSSITTWVDKSGNGRNASRVSGSPTYTDKNIFFNSAASDLLRTSSYISITQYSTVIFIVANPSSNAPSGTIQDMLAFTDIAATYSVGSGSIRYTNILLNGVAGNGDANDIGNNNYYLNGTFNTALASYSSRHIINCTVQLSGGSTRISLSDSFFSRYFYGNINEVIVYNSLSSSQRQQIEGYLAWKWGLQGNLPTTHPYRNTPVYTNPPFPLVPIVRSTTNNTVFSPTSITGCKLWLDGTDPNGNGIRPFNGDLVPRWIDKSGSGNTATASTPATFVINSINSLPTVYFDGTTNRPYSGPLTITNNSITAFIIFTSAMNAGNEGMRLLAFLGSGLADWNSISTGIIFLYDTNRIQTWRNSVVTANINLPTQGTAILSTTYYDGSIGYNSIFGGSSANTSSVSGNFNTTSYVFANGNINMKGNIGEILLYNTFLSTAQRQQVEGYLAWKWGLVANLPLGHPYKTQSLAPFSYAVRTVTQNKWQPTQIAGCQLWLDGADSTSFTLSGSNLTGWRDKSGTNKTITVNSAPTYSARGFNTSYPAFTFTSSKYLTTTLSSSIGTGDCVFVVVMKNAGTDAQNNVMSLGAPAGGTEIGMGWNQGQALYKFYQYGSGEGQDNTTANNTNMMSIGIRRSSTMALYVNGKNPSSTGTNTVNNGNTTVYIGAASGFTFIGEISEVIFYVSSITTQQRQNLEGYLAWKWGLVSSLPATHPYKLFPPAPS